MWLNVAGPLRGLRPWINNDQQWRCGRSVWSKKEQLDRDSWRDFKHSLHTGIELYMMLKPFHVFHLAKTQPSLVLLLFSHSDTTNRWEHMDAFRQNLDVAECHFINCGRVDVFIATLMSSRPQMCNSGHIVLLIALNWSVQITLGWSPFFYCSAAWFVRFVIANVFYLKVPSFQFL